MKSPHLGIAIIFFILFRIEEREATNLNCGRRVPDYNALIIDGFSSNKHWPWHAAIYHVQKRQEARSEPKIEDYKCGGTLINSKLILTGAHCVCNNDQQIDPEKVKVCLGKLYLNAVNIIKHPDYNSIDQSNDIAIIRLATEATFNNYVQPICLWESNKLDLSEVIGKEGTVIGWGITGTDTISNILQQAFMPVVPSLTCLASNRNFFGSFLSDKNFCAGSQNGTSVCNGDSGGAMTFEEHGVYYLRGIVSVSQARNDKRAEKRILCDPNEYVIFTDVAQYLPWIEKVEQDAEHIFEQVLDQGLINSTCGRRLVDDSGRNVAERFYSIEGRWPWHAAIYRDVQEQDNKYDCGGTLIDSRSILTVAHCMWKFDSGEPKKPEEILVLLGISNLSAYESNFPFFNVAEIVLHPKFTWENKENNIAIIRLSVEATFNKYVQPICLWDSKKLDLSEVIGRQGTVIGWGVTQSGELVNTLGEELMPVVSYSMCVRSNPNVFGNLLSDTEFCAGSRNGSIVCNGFSGGSMAFEENGVYYIRGIVSSAISTQYGVCNPNEYVIFTDVARYLHWIKQVADHFAV